MLFRKKEYKKCFWRKLFGIVSLLFVPLFISSANASAVSVTNILSAQSSYTENFDSTVKYFTTSGNTPLTVLSRSSITGLWDYSLNFVFANPVSNHTGTGFTHTITYTLTSNGNYINSNLTSQLVNSSLRFENVSADMPYCSSVLEIIALSSSSVTFKQQTSCPYGSYTDGTNFQNVLSTVNYNPNSLFWCANDSSRTCPSTLSVTLSNVNYEFKLNTSDSDSLLQTQINQNQEFYNANYDSVSNISDQTTSDISGATNAQTTSIIGIISSFVTAMQSVQAGSCELTLPFPSFVGGNTVVNPCSGKEKAPTIVSVGSSMFLIGVFVPFAFIVLKMIFGEIRSFTNG